MQFFIFSLERMVCFTIFMKDTLKRLWQQVDSGNSTQLTFYHIALRGISTKKTKKLNYLKLLFVGTFFIVHFLRRQYSEKKCKSNH